MALYDALHNRVLRMYPLEGWARLHLHQGQYAEALPLAQEALALAITHQSQITQITALSCLGHAYVGLQLWPQAQTAYARAAVLLPALPRWAMESVVGLAYVAWQMGDECAARTHIQQFMALLATSPIEGSSSPTLSYGRAVQVLRALGEERQATAVYTTGQKWLDEQAQHLTGAELAQFWAAQAIHGERAYALA